MSNHNDTNHNAEDTSILPDNRCPPASVTRPSRVITRSISQATKVNHSPIEHPRNSSIDMMDYPSTSSNTVMNLCISPIIVRERGSDSSSASLSPVTLTDNRLSEISDDTDGISDMFTSVHTDVSNRESHDRSEAAMIRLLQSIRDDLNPRRNMIDDIT